MKLNSVVLVFVGILFKVVAVEQVEDDMTIMTKYEFEKMERKMREEEEDAKR